MDQLLLFSSKATPNLNCKWNACFAFTAPTYLIVLQIVCSPSKFDRDFACEQVSFGNRDCAESKLFRRERHLASPPPHRASIELAFVYESQVSNYDDQVPNKCGQFVYGV